ncbi:PD-(D/E)XK nuclease family protein [Streptomyces sp. NPDC012450]|uniref:PD-(D/E)XK nuclease family protein n=1 Tax=Streptomyces sp. NPDC012450 TaxID=3364834 RepID=UPI0036EA32BB
MSLSLPPPGTDGDIRLIRTSLPLLRESPDDCPRGNALRARPFVRQAPPRSRRTPFEEFALGPVMKALDSIEHDETELESALAQLRRNPKNHAGHVDWADSAIRSYLSARAAHEARRHALGHPATLPVRTQWTAIAWRDSPDSRGATRYERTAWGRRYASADGSERELWLLSVNSVKSDRPAAEIAEAASVMVNGVPSRSTPREVFRPIADHIRPKRVRIIGIGCGSGEHEVLADWDADEADRQFTAHAKPALARVVEDGRLTPGSSCVRCEGLMGCGLPHRTPGILGVPGPRRPRARRSVSATDLRVHSLCPAQFHLTRVLHLKSGTPENLPIRRGRAVDEWLNLLHEEGCCRNAPLPDLLPGLTASELPTALAMLSQHQRACPLDGLPTAERVRVQPRLTAYDPELDVVLIADPDLLYTRAGGWIWHETKTAAKRPWEGRALMETYPQLAFAVLMMSAGVLDGDPRRSLIELEVLYENGSRCEEIDPGDPDTQAEARRIIAALAGPWAVDETYVPRPDDHCKGCDALAHCAVGRAHVETR